MQLTPRICFGGLLKNLIHINPCTNNWMRNQFNVAQLNSRRNEEAQSNWCYGAPSQSSLGRNNAHAISAVWRPSLEPVKSRGTRPQRFFGRPFVPDAIECTTSKKKIRFIHGSNPQLSVSFNRKPIWSLDGWGSR